MASGVNLFVASLDKRIDDKFLRNMFSKYGELFSVQVSKDESGASKGFGFVHFSSTKDGIRAKEEMNGKAYYGRTIHVELANTQRDGKCSNDGNMTSIWANDWKKYSSAFGLDRESNYDSRSQISDSTVDDQNSAGISDVKGRMRKLFESQFHTDVTFYSKSDSKMSISAHRAVLAIESPLFTKMLYGDKNEYTPGVEMKVQISNMSFKAFTNIVKYIYTDEVFFEDDTLVQSILEGAKQFKIRPLVKRCIQYFENIELTEENVCMKLQMGLSNKIDVLKEKCIEFIQNNTLQVINSPDFFKCNPTSMRTICKLQSLNLRNEAELLDAVMLWRNSQPPHNRKSVMEPLIKCIRFLTFSVGDLGDALKKYPDLMTSDEGLSIMLFLYNPPKTPNFSSMPSWLNKNAASRCYYKDDNPSSNMVPGVSVIDATGALVGKMVFPLKADLAQTSVTELTSLLQLKCIRGFHQLKAIRLTFDESPACGQRSIGSLTLNVHVHPSGFKTSETIQIVDSETVRVEFKQKIIARRGDLVDIEAEARNIRMYRFLQFDETGHLPVNAHFNSFISSRPKLGKLFFIHELEYGPQEKLPQENRPQEKHFNAARRRREFRRVRKN